MNAALYIRVSTEDQIELSPDSQKKLLLDYACKNGLIVDDEHIFMDEGISGRKAEKRPAFMKMIGLAKKKENKPFNRILVWKFSRFARNQEESIVYKNMLRKDGVEVISISEPIIDGPFGSLIERIIEWMDEYYSIRLSSEVFRGMKEKAQRGGVQSSKPFGYDIIDNKYVVIPEQADAIKLIYSKFIDGLGYKEIANILNARGILNKKGNMFEGRNIKYILENPVYCGLVRWNYASQQNGSRKIKDASEWIISQGNHAPIISKEMYEEAQKIIKSKNNTYQDRKPLISEYKHYLGGLLRCSSCGGTLTYAAYSKSSITPNSKYRGYFLCNKFRKGSCDTKTHITVKQAEAAILSTLKDNLSKFENKKYKSICIDIKNNEDDIRILKKQLTRIPDKLKKAKDLYINGIDSIEEFSATKQTLLNEKKELEDKIKQYESKGIDQKYFINKINTTIQLIENNCDKNTINKQLKGFISKIVIDNLSKTFEIHYFKKS